MMICPKCAGLMVSEWIKDFFVPIWQARCLQCGAVLDKTIYQHRQLSRAKGVEMPKFLSEEDKQAWVNKVQATRAKTMAARKKQNEEAIVLDDDGEQEEKRPVRMPEPEHNGHDGPSWKVQTVLKLMDRKDSLMTQVHEIDSAIQAVKALA